MRNLFAYKPIIVHVQPGTTIYHAIKEALELSSQLEIEVLIRFNDKEIPCHHRNHTVEERVAFYLN